MVPSWILNTISKDLVAGFWYFFSAYDFWNDLKDYFGVSTGPMLYKIQRAICSITQGHVSVTTYYTSLKRYWDEYNCLVAKPKCTCGGRTCGATRDLNIAFN